MKSFNLIHQQFGKLTVVEVVTDHGINKWKCQCECGEICYKSTNYLLKPLNSNTQKACSKSCGAAPSIGSIFERLEVIENIFIPNQPTKVKCRCECGKEIIVPAGRLKRGGVKSCGCYRADKMSELGKTSKSDLTNQKFGLLTALEPTDQRLNRGVIWKCQCDCGNIHYASLTNLKSGSVSRCKDCFIRSKGEEKIKLLLQKNDFSFETEKTFFDCIGEQKHPYRFDFYVENQYLIEFDGIQHYKTGGWNTIENLKNTQQRDQYKNSWCQKNKIPLIRIPYYKLETLTIEDLKLETTKYLI